MTTVRVEASGAEGAARAFQEFPALFARFAAANLARLGTRVRHFCKVELEDTRTTGALERSFVVRPLRNPSGVGIVVYPTAKHAIFVRRGTRPHWAPIAPLKRWAAIKLGDPDAAYAVQRSIAKHGTSMFQYHKRGTKANPWPLRVIRRGDFKTALRHTAKRIALDLVAEVVEGVQR